MAYNVDPGKTADPSNGKFGITEMRWFSGKNLGFLCAVTVLLAVAGLALTIWMFANNPSNPSIGLDEWVVTDTISSQGFIDAVLAGHNGTPTYFQNLLWRIDFDYFNYEGVLPRWFQNSALFIGFLGLIFSVRFAGLELTKTFLVASLFILLWFSVHNSAHYGRWYVWRGAEASGILLLLSVSLFASLKVIKSIGQSKGTVIGYYILSAATSWLALYFHGGFLILPIILGLMAVSIRDSRIVVFSLTIVSVFSYHFLQVHPVSPAQSETSANLETVLFGFAVIPANLAYKSINAQLGSGYAAVAAVVTTAIGSAFAVWLLYALRKSVEKQGIRFIAAVLLAYPLGIAASIAYARLTHEADWQYALAWRYRNYSALFLIGLLLASWSLPTTIRNWRCGKTLKYAVGFLIGTIGLITGIDSVRNMNSVWWMPAFFQSYMVPLTFDDWFLPDHSIMNERRRNHAQHFRDLLENSGANVFAVKGYAHYRKFRDQVHAQAEFGEVAKCHLNWNLIRTEETDRGYLIEIKGWLSDPWSDIPGTLLFFDETTTILGWAQRFRPARWPWEAEFWATQAGNIAWGYALVPSHVADLQAGLVDESGHWICKANPMKIDQG